MYLVVWLLVLCLVCVGWLLECGLFHGGVLRCIFVVSLLGVLLADVCALCLFVGVVWWVGCAALCFVWVWWLIGLRSVRCGGG